MSNIPELVRAIEEKYDIRLEKDDPILLDFEAKAKFQEDMVNTVRDMLNDHQRKLDASAKSIFTGIVDDMEKLTNEATHFMRDGVNTSKEKAVKELDGYFQSRVKVLKSELSIQDKATTWGSYAAVAGGTLLLGFVIGFMLALHMRFH